MEEKEKKFVERRKVDSLLECLYFLAKYFEQPVSKESLIADLAVYNTFMDINAFFESSKRINLLPKLIQRDLHNIPELMLPAVLMLKKGRACVLLKMDEIKGEATVIMPGISYGETIMTKEKLLNEYMGEMIIIKPEFKYQNKIDKSIVIEENNKWFKDVIFKNFSIYRQVIIATILINFFVIAVPLFTMNVYDRVLPNNGIATLWVFAIGVSAVIAFDFIISLLRSYYIEIAGKRADVIISNRIFSHVLNIRLDSKPTSTGQFVSRLQSFSNVRDFFTTASLSVLVDIPFVVIFITIIFFIGGVLGYLSLASIVIMLLFSWYMQKPLSKLVKQSLKDDQIKQTTLTETISGLEVIKGVRAQNRMRTLWENSIINTAQNSEKINFVSQFASGFTNNFAKFSNIAIVVAGVYLASDGTITQGAIIGAMMLNGRVIAPVSKLSGMIIKFDKTMQSLKNIDEIMKMPVERKNQGYLSRPKLKGDIEFIDVNFSYGKQNIQTLKNINLKIKDGDKVAILGKIGCGKSTLAKLILNLYEPKSGSILIDNTDIRQIDPVDLRRNVGYVPQDPFLFMGSIRDNITIGERFATDEEVIEAAKIAGVHDFLGKHEAGYDLQVGERGEGLSGGEKQSVALARAVLSSPNIIIFDEPTNSMDSQTERAFIKNVKNYVGNKTLIVITHKTSILELVDRVIVIDNGKIVADGDKDVILKKSSNANKGN